METVTLQGPVVVLQAGDYHNMVDRISQLENIIGKFAQLFENLEDVQMMRQAEVEYQAGDRIAFDELLTEIETETVNVPS